MRLRKNVFFLVCLIFSSITLAIVFLMSNRIVYAACALNTQYQTPDLGDACTACIASKTGVIDDVQYVKQYNPDCATRQIVNHICNGGISTQNASGCLAVKNSECASVCGVSTSVAPTATVAPTTPPTSIPTSTLTPTLTPTPTPASATAFYRISDRSFTGSAAPDPGKGVPEWQRYTDDPLKITYEFRNVTLGNNITLFAQFKSDTGEVGDVLQKSIKYIGDDPQVTNISCQFNPTGVGTLITINGTNFGERGNASVTVAGKAADITSWTIVPPDITPTPSASASASSQPSATASPTATLTLTSTPTPTATLTLSPSPSPTDAPVPTTAEPYRVGVKINDKIDGRTQIQLTLDGGQVLRGSCEIGLTTVDFMAKQQCRPVIGDSSLDTTRVQITEDAPGARPLFDSKIKFGQDGIPVWSTPKLEVDKLYSLILVSPKSVAVKKTFTALEGTTVLEDMLLPVGDIFPIAIPDNAINSLDNSELIREWATLTDVSKPGDFNVDSRVNTMDYACMRANIGKTGENFVR